MFNPERLVFVPRDHFRFPRRLELVQLSHVGLGLVGFRPFLFPTDASEWYVSTPLSAFSQIVGIRCKFNLLKLRIWWA